MAGAAKLVKRKSKPLRFSTEDTVVVRGRRRAVFVEATPFGAKLWLKNMPTSAVEVSWEALYRSAVQLNGIADRNRMRAERLALLEREVRRAG